MVSFIFYAPLCVTTYYPHPHFFSIFNFLYFSSFLSWSTSITIATLIYYHHPSSMLLLILLLSVAHILLTVLSWVYTYSILSVVLVCVCERWCVWVKLAIYNPLTNIYIYIPLFIIYTYIRFIPHSLCTLTLNLRYNFGLWLFL